MKIDVRLVEKTISRLPFIQTINSLEESDLIISGKFTVFFNGLDRELEFDVVIYPTYPLKRYSSESIKFINKNLISYDHVMADGSICIHTTHSVDPIKKLISDFNSLKNWIEKYFLRKDEDKNYEHIIVPECIFKECYYSFIFTAIEHQFQKGDYGYVDVSSLASSRFKQKTIHNLVVQYFHISTDKHVSCKWSKKYLDAPPSQRGFFVFVDNQPATNKRFVYKKWDYFNGIFPQALIDDLYKFEKTKKKKYKGALIPIFIGYKTLEENIHWQVAMIEIGSFPIHGIAERINGVKTGKWLGEFGSEEIKWAITRDASYKFFFGRGALSRKITESKILIIGLGAVGSLLAKTLTKGGCKKIDIADYDVKYPENVCRSEYSFLMGIGDKVEELPKILSSESPFLDIKIFNEEYFEDIIKGFFDRNQIFSSEFSAMLDDYDIVFDCTTDDDLMYVLNSLQLKCDLINLSITNHAKHLICGFHPNIYNFVRTQFDELLDHDTENLYEPLGCWSPTFKASYNDINLLVQYAIKRIDNIFKENREGKTKNNFVINTEKNDSFQLNIVEF